MSNSGKRKRRPGPGRKTGAGGRRNQPRAAYSSARSPKGELAEGELVDPYWLAGSIAGVAALAAVCAYLALCLLFWQGQWQLLLHPSHDLPATPASAGIAYEDVRFGGGTGNLPLDGWWIPAGPAARYPWATILVCRDGSGSLSSFIPQLPALHSLGLNIFVFDYRGFGKSAALHPSEKSMTGDAEAAWSYLRAARRIAPQSIVLYGVRLGSTMAAGLAARHPEASSLILEDPQPTGLQQIDRDPRSRWLPVRLLLRDRFDPTRDLSATGLPKLLLGADAPPLYFGAAAQPKQEAILLRKPMQMDPGYSAAVLSFLGQVLHAPQRTANP